MTEAMVAARIEAVARAADRQPAFPVIATVRGAVLHNHEHGGVLRDGDLFLVDAGGQSARHYAGDLSSTFPVSPTFDPRQRTMYELSLQAHEAALATVAPGVPNLDVHLAAARAITVGLVDLGLMRGDPDEAVAAGAHALFFPCGVGHMLGLGVHDMEELGEHFVGDAEQPRDPRFGFKSLRLARELEPGFVLTIEPGIYFIPQLIDRWRADGHLASFYRWTPSTSGVIWADPQRGGCPGHRRRPARARQAQAQDCRGGRGAPTGVIGVELAIASSSAIGLISF